MSSDTYTVKEMQQMIMNEIKELRQENKAITETTTAKLDKIERHVIETNGKVKLARWIATTALSLVTIVITYLIKAR